MTYFRHDAPLALGETVELRGQEAHHLLAVRRVRIGERFALQDPAGRRFQAELTGAERRAARAAIRAELTVPPPPALRLTLLQAAVKAPAADLIVEKCTELGAAALCFFPAERSSGAPAALAAPRTLARWERIAWEACKQSDRQFPPDLLFASDLHAVLAMHRVDPAGGVRGWALHPGAARPAADALAETGRSLRALHVLIGPEGGLTPGELAAAGDAGYAPLGLGATILRAETAALAVCALALLGR